MASKALQGYGSDRPPSASPLPSSSIVPGASAQLTFFQLFRDAMLSLPLTLPST